MSVLQSSGRAKRDHRDTADACRRAYSFSFKSQRSITTPSQCSPRTAGEGDHDGPATRTCGILSLWGNETRFLRHASSFSAGDDILESQMLRNTNSIETQRDRAIKQSAGFLYFGEIRA